MAVPTRLERQAQLQSILPTAISPRRPLLTHLSTDNSWLLSLPIPKSTAAPGQNIDGKHQNVYFHLLLDAWLTPSNAAFESARWFQVQYHVETPACPSIAAVNDLIADIEAAASGVLASDLEGKTKVGAVVVGHFANDHANRDTLIQVSASVPVFAADIAFSTVQSWKHFETVVSIPEFGAGDGDGSLDWRTASSTEAPHLPSWLTVWRISGPKRPPALHWAVCIVFDVGETSQGQAECVIHSPHGPYLEDVDVLKRLDPLVKTLALLHTTKESWYYRWGKANMGAKHGAQVAEAVGPRYWISTHDELNTTTGFNKWFLKDVPNDGAEVVRDEKEKGRLKGLEFVQVGNGESFVLAS
ncbi:hypothetical protein N431DRAFT_387109 [Stipitochalara longipes BDJ]|nr:hypothetical protein N431DRAFT_387109 [Stipitochalara longipes BDJ]